MFHQPSGSHAYVIYLSIVLATLVIGTYVVTYTDLTSRSTALSAQWMPEFLTQLTKAYQSIMSQNSSVYSNRTHLFNRRLTPVEKQRFFTILDKLHEVSLQQNLTYFLACGTMLGSYRHHDLVPWDDDMDVLVPLTQKKRLMKVYESIEDHVYYPVGRDGKLSLTYGRKYGENYRGGDPYHHGYEYTFPFMDVFYYEQNDTHLTYASHHHHPIPLEEIFPLRLRPLNNKLYFGPRDPHKYLHNLGFNIDDCYSGGYDHANERRYRKDQIGKVPCATFIDTVPFVTHVQGPAGAWCQEVLTIGGKVLQNFVRSKKGIPEC